MDERRLGPCLRAIRGCEQGWAIVGFGQIYKNAQPVGLSVKMTIATDGKSVLTYVPTDPSGHEELSVWLSCARDW